MTIASYILGIAAAMLALGVVTEMLRRRRLRERHAIWWIIAGVLALVIGVFPQVLIWTAAAVGVEVPTNLVFFVSLFILFLVCIQQSAELTELEGKTRALAEYSALLANRVTQLETATHRADAGDTP
ncbi:DUF2304 domain-containing protein [Cryobacterium sp. TMT1-21]|uniref:DUF2304 domain-containing protein n=1 Tax=Cryobacterium shii TaxID=1259235 RepID=A0AAQ2C5E1_9MICO|nr:MULTISPECIES: DUF2304 domain-containing protein [Cryobacterium]TFC44943.1 DUF2304 domain-containing protein [Cryobacterium shii]TFC89622.1 DUF2304 domain-containing protein [Cryobacterium sp. TmT2-59]TFD11992.1 DUF2304 domain-containing protein [Cryobacterium sp. TMT4-10]TFD16867.1 DUF2304 domain-containing protein [Cryobacterium sp. TMT1-21]